MGRKLKGKRKSINDNKEGKNGSPKKKALTFLSLSLVLLITWLTKAVLQHFKTFSISKFKEMQLASL